MTQKTDARQVVTNYTYDNLNRVLTRTYSAPQNLPNYQAAPNVTYTYDDISIAFSKGKLTKMSSSLSETRYTQFDNIGRVLSSQQITDGQTYTSSYVYNLSGALIEQTYPSGRVVKNTLDNDGDLMQVQSRKANDTFRNYANSFNYTAAGAVSSLRLGNGKWETTSFNSRLQPIQIGLGSSAANQNLLKLNFDYGITDNNGNVKSQQITVPNVGANAGFTATQTYTYDSLNRLKDAKEMIGTTQTWKQTFTFDRYGNRRFDTANTTTLPTGCIEAVCNPNINAANNRLVGYQFDNAGNTTTDAENRTFIYDAENKQKEVKNSANQSIGQYFYDGDGKRVKKFIYNTQETTIFVYDASGKMVAEYSTTVAPVAEAKVSYLTTDHLGSPRITTDANGQVISRRDFMPFGEEVFTAQRTQGLGYTADTIRQKFATYERDNESELDFAQARYYSSKLGRFYSVDPENAGASEDDPQSWNAYVYSGNNPILYSDPAGLDYVICNNKGECVTQSDNDILRGKNQQGALFQETGRNGEYDSGNILNDDGSPLGTYRRISIDPINRFFIGFGNQATRSTRVVGASAVLAGAIGVCIALCAPAAIALAPAIPGIIGRGLGITAATLGLNGCAEGTNAPGGGGGSSPGGCGGATNSQIQKTPTTNPDRFEPVRGQSAKRDKQTGEIWVFDRLHRNHYEVYKNLRDYQRGRRNRSVWEDGRPKETF